MASKLQTMKTMYLLNLKSQLKTILFLTVLFSSFQSFSQTTESNTATDVYFAQGYFVLANGMEISELQEELNNNANIQAVRFDLENNVYFVFTQNIESLNKNLLLEWFGNYFSEIHCTQIGVLGVTERQTIPFENCVD